MNHVHSLYPLRQHTLWLCHFSLMRTVNPNEHCHKGRTEMLELSNLYRYLSFHFTFSGWWTFAEEWIAFKVSNRIRTFAQPPLYPSCTLHSLWGLKNCYSSPLSAKSRRKFIYCSNWSLKDLNLSYLWKTPHLYKWWIFSCWNLHRQQNISLYVLPFEMYCCVYISKFRIFPLIKTLTYMFPDWMNRK